MDTIPTIMLIDKRAINGYNVVHTSKRITLLYPGIKLGLMLRKLLIFFLITVFSTIQVNVGFASILDRCTSGSTPLVPFVSSPHAHSCCTETEPCCCHAGQEAGPSQPDMALNVTTGGSSDHASRLTTPNAGTQTLLLVQNHQPPRIFDGMGPPFASHYLTNLTFRC